MRSRMLAVSVGALAAFAWTAGVGAQPSTPPAPSSPPSGDASGWRAVPEVGAELTFDDNVFLLAPGKKDNLDPVSAVNAASGRYADMESASDLIATLDGTVGIRGDGFGGRRLTITPELRAELFASNTKRTNVRLGLTIEQALPKDGRLRLRDRYTPSYFAKNYLADAVDGNGDGTIALDERRYRAGTYAENEASLDWRFRLARSSRSHPVGAMMQLGVGHYLRTYEEPFGGRDLSGPTAAAALDLDLAEGTTLELGYDLAVLAADPGPEVLLLDETDFGVDFNSDGDAVDAEARTVQTVDRSRTEHTLGATLQVDTSPRSRVTAAYTLRVRSFGSDEPYDVIDRDRRDTRHAFTASLRIELDRSTDLTFGGEIANQTTNRGGDPGSTGDEDDYGRHAVFAAITWRR